jgi:predicted nucleotidyltransferase
MMIVGNSLQQGQTVATDDVLLHNHILKTLKYFHVFRHPLNVEEIHAFLQTEVSKDKLQHILSEMVRDERIFYAHNLYSLENSAQIFLKRRVGADMAAEKMKEARRCAAIIAAFPFVRGICVSGSLSKGYADEKSDIDFFIITAEKRLWISRTILHLFKKLTFLANRQHSFCMNYFIDGSRLNLEEKNLFTATELVTLIPVYNSDLHRELVGLNKAWIADIFPNNDIDHTQHNAFNTTSFIKKPVEWLLNKLWPEKFNNFLMKLTDRLWRHKWERKNYPMEDYELAMKTKWYVSKQHPLNYQKKVLEINDAPVLQF